jgi:hypothetical protein
MLYLALELNSEPVKYAILALTAPLWIPFIKALWTTLDDSLRDEGGLMGEAPTREKLREMEEKHGHVAESMLSDPIGFSDATPIGTPPASAPRATGTSMAQSRGFR